MTTIAYHRPSKTIGVDSRNTDGSGVVFMCDKIEHLKNGYVFLGAGHCYPMSKVKYWASTGFSNDARPEFDELFSESREDYSMSCLIISPDGEEVTLMDDEITPTKVLDDIVTIGSGGPYARAALRAGASMEEAINIAIEYDGNSGGPVRTYTFPSGKKKAYRSRL